MHLFSYNLQKKKSREKVKRGKLPAAKNEYQRWGLGMFEMHNIYPCMF